MAFKDSPEKKLFREEAKKKPFTMGNILFKGAFETQYGTPWFAKYIFWALLNHMKVIIKLPRFHAKSTYVTFLYVMWCILTRRKKFILIVSSTGNQAVKFLARISSYLRSKPVREIYGDLDAAEAVVDTDNFDVEFIEGKGNKRSPVWNFKEIYIPVWGIRIMASSIGSANRGLLSIDDRPDLLILDDVESKANTNTPVLRQRIIETIFEELDPAGLFGCQTIAIGTICHYGSYLLKVEKSDQWYAIPIDRATMTMKQIEEMNARIPEERFKFKPKQEYFTKDTVGLDGEKYKAGDSFPEFAIWQEKYTYQMWSNKHKELSDIDLEASFWQEYYNRPKAGSRQVFKKYRYLTDFEVDRHYDKLILRSPSWLFPNGKRFINVIPFLGGDLAVSDEESADWRVFTTLFADPYKNVYVLPQYQTREPDPFVYGKWLLEQNNYYNYDSATFDGVSFQKWFGNILRHLYMNEKERNGKRKYKHMRVVSQSRSENKIDVIRSSVSPHFRKMYFLGEEEEFLDLVHQLSNLGYTEHDDHADSLSYACSNIRFPDLIHFEKVKPLDTKLDDDIFEGVRKEDRWLVA